MSSVVYLTRKENFSASHRLHSEHLNPQENLQLFGKCNSKNGHGHNYGLEVTVRAKTDQHGLVMNLSDLKQVIQDQIISRFDHKHLNLDTEEFKTLNPTAENIAVVCFRLLETRLPKGSLFEVRVNETEKNTAIYRGE